MKTVAVILAAGLAGALAACPNFCSQHGSCGADDKCHCWNGYEGYDCSKRACPFVEAWAVDHLEGAHQYTECAGRGLCDRSSGLCDCFPGFEGRGCERAACPNACSGNGQCRLIADLANIVNEDAASPALGNAIEWDEKALTACVCDGGYTGADCSQRICPYGDDPMTLCETAEAEQVQKVTVSWTGEFGDTGNVNGFNQARLENGDMAFQFKTYANEVLSTKAISSFTSGNQPITTSTGATNLAAALEALPNFRVRDVTATLVTTAWTDGTTSEVNSYEITFHHLSGTQNSFGRQNLLMCPHEREYAISSSATDSTFGCGAEGCQPRFYQPRIVVALTALVSGNTPVFATSAYTNAATVASSAYTMGPTIAGLLGQASAFFSPDSVLTCPRGLYCPRSTTAMQGAIHMQLIPSGSSTLVYVKGVAPGSAGTNGNGGVQTMFLDDDSAATTTRDGLVAATTENNYIYMGKLADFPDYSGSVTYGNSASTPTALTSAQQKAKLVDISEIMPDTALVVFSGIAPTAAQQTILAYTTPSCSASTDITVSASKEHENVDSENIECAGRGECDRSNGLCQCFEGYTGNNCGSQTILV